MPKNADRITALFQLYINNSISKKEYEELWMLLKDKNLSHSLSAELKLLWPYNAANSETLTGEAQHKMDTLIQKLNLAETHSVSHKKVFTLSRYKWAAAAAVFLIVFSTLTFSWLRSSKTRPSPIASNISEKNNADHLQPGGNKAVLVLADGTTVVLDSSSNGTIASQGSTKIIKLNSGQLVYNTGDKVVANLYNTLTTPLGGQYQVTLSDGTDVWLNSGSSLRYPTAFAGNERIVEVTGEAYFEVAKNPSKPFKVKINVANGVGGEVQVLGTHFNINAYDDEAAVRTTLLEGSVKINMPGGIAKLTPGQQCQSTKQGNVKVVNDADLEEVVAWKEGRFQFENADIKYIMRQLARWYDIEIDYKGNIPDHFGGTISRNVNVLKVLNMLQLTGQVNFKVEGRKVMVMP